MFPSSNQSIDQPEQALEAPLDKKHHPDFITLQRIEHDLSTFRLLKISVTIMLAFAITKLIINIVHPGSNRSTIGLILEVLQTLGFGFGLQAHISKNLIQALIFQYYLIFSTAVTIYYLITNSENQEWILLAAEIIQILLIFFLFVVIRRFIHLLRRRDECKRELKKFNTL